ncbi:hypothetical protein D9M71_456130 [compost metagenome]
MTKKMLLRELESILLNLTRACKKAEKVALKIDVPSLVELEFIKTQVEQLIAIDKGEKDEQ